MIGIVAPNATVSTYGPIVVSVLSLALLAVAMGVAWWTKDPSLPILLGVAGSNATTVVGYWLGSSVGSKAKDATMAATATASAATIATLTPPAKDTP